MNPNDKAMLETAKAGWWAKSRTGSLIVDDCPWQQVVGECNDGRLVLFQMYFQNGQPKPAVEYCNKDDILALHAPTDNPQMATAYKLGEPEEVTREEAEKMVKSNWYWLLPDDQQIRHAIDVLPLENIILMVETAYAIESPGGNVYRIKD